MVNLNIGLDKLFLHLLVILLFSSINLFDIQATASSDITVNDASFLRGEIWYGNASWYGSKFHGRKTSNGEKYNKNKLTAAHRDLPFNTQVLVTNLQNNKSVIVRINDRGPFIGGRIIDVSEEAAETIDLRKKGVAYIKLQVLNPLVVNQKIAELRNKS